MRTLHLVAGTGCAVVGGVFFAFSTFVVPALRRLPGAEAGRAMRSINAAAVRPVFMLALFGTAAACAALGVAGARRGDARLLAGCAGYLVGVVGVTLAANVPLNERLDRRQVAFEDFAVAWSRWNHVRTLSGTGAAVLLLTDAAGRAPAPVT